ncbi:sensor histidine kinase [Maribellus luteus]|nr:histidine kinase [Maribellus luteus]
MKQYLVQPKEKTIDKSVLITVIIVLVALLVLVVSVLLVWKWRVQQQFRKEQRERRLRELELTAIRSQMNPHFLFNSLNSVQNLVQKNMGREAHLYLADFAGLIRKVLNNSEKEEVSLAEELEMTEQYLRLEQLRFDFDYSMEIDSEIDVHNTLVPSMLLQPFVENAIVHGLQNKTSDRKLKITMKRRDSEIKIEIEDNGVGREAAKELSKTKNGKGTKLISERLQLLKEKQGEKYLLETIDLPEGTRVEIIIPEEN